MPCKKPAESTVCSFVRHALILMDAAYPMAVLTSHPTKRPPA